MRRLGLSDYHLCLHVPQRLPPLSACPSAITTSVCMSMFQAVPTLGKPEHTVCGVQMFVAKYLADLHTELGSTSPLPDLHSNATVRCGILTMDCHPTPSSINGLRDSKLDPQLSEQRHICQRQTCPTLRAFAAVIIW